MTAKRFNFTKPVIDALPLPEQGKRAYYYEPKTRGFCVGVTSAGVKTFYLYRKINGRPERIRIGKYPDMSIEQARNKAEKLNGEIAEGKNPQDAKRALRAEATFDELFEAYVSDHSKLNKLTWREDIDKYRRHIQKRIGKKKLSAITRADISHIHNAVTKAGHRTTANRVLALISGVYGWAIKEEHWHSNPAKGIRRNKELARARFIQSDEMPRFFAALRDEPNKTVRDYLLTALLTGARRSNVLEMRWEDINFDRSEWFIGRTKNGESQTVCLSPEAVEVLRNRMPAEPTGFVFPGTGRTGHFTSPDKAWERVLERAGITNLRIHDLRRTLGSWQARAGASLIIIGKSLNHRDPKTTAIYARLDSDPVRDSVNSATAAMLAAAGLKNGDNVVPLARKKR